MKFLGNYLLPPYFCASEYCKLRSKTKTFSEQTEREREVKMFFPGNPDVDLYHLPSGDDKAQPKPRCYRSTMITI